MKLPKEFVIFDTEFTSWEGAMARKWSGPGEHRELVQVGAIKVVELEETNSLSILVKPTINPELSDYFINLTKITQAAIDTEGVSFSEAQQRFYDWSVGLPLCSFSGRDQEIFAENAELYQQPYLLGDFGIINAREVIETTTGISTTGYISSTIPEAFGLTPPPDRHNALNDARSILMALKAVYTDT